MRDAVPVRRGELTATLVALRIDRLGAHPADSVMSAWRGAIAWFWQGYDRQADILNRPDAKAQREFVSHKLQKRLGWLNHHVNLVQHIHVVRAISHLRSLPWPQVAKIVDQLPDHPQGVS